MSLVDLLHAMFWSPEAHPDPYTWATVLLAHATVGAVLAAVAALLAAAVGILWTGIRSRDD